MREQEDKEAQLIIPRGLQAEVIHLKYEGHQGTDQTLGLMQIAADMLVPRHGGWGAGSRSLWRPAGHAKHHSPGQGQSLSSRPRTLRGSGRCYTAAIRG